MSEPKKIAPVVAAQSLARTFTSCFPYRKPFQPLLSQRMIVGLILDDLNPDQFAALSAAARGVGDDYFYYASVSAGEAEDEHWPAASLADAVEVREGDFQTYRNVYRALIAANQTQALWSPNAYWGLLVTTDWFGVVGAVDGFLTTFKHEWPPWPPDRKRPDTTPPDRQVELFMETLRDDPTFDMSELLTHIYGEDRARVLLQS